MLNKCVPLQVSKWIKLPLLIEKEEIEDLIQKIPPFKIYDVQKVTAQGEGVYSSSLLIEKYGAYLEYLKSGKIPPMQEFRSIFSSVWSVDEKALYEIPALESRRLWKACEPVVQCQINQIRFDQEQHSFRTQVFSSDSIAWGIQIGFPHLYLDPKTHDVGKTHTFANMALFLAIQRWLRTATVPTPFLVEGKKINSPIRLGKKCFSWISCHPQLAVNGIQVELKHGL